ncbi:MAG: PorT family protein [Bacteroidota bacterium]|nr:PorT family protein [Bacteroidota bacterium]
MKKLFTSMALILILVITSNARSQSIGLGLEAGINIANSKITPKLSTSPDSRTGLIVGGVIDIGINRNISIVSGIRYVMKGAKVTSGGTTETGKLDYLEFPVLFKYKFPLTEVNPYIILGPTLGINLSAEVETDNGQTTTTEDFKENIESSDFGLLFGAGLDFRVGTMTNLFFQTAYSLGLTDINKIANSTVEIKNYGIQITGGVKFNLK